MSAQNIKSILSQSASFEDRFIPDLEHLKVVTKNLQDAGYKVVLTQGVYDLLHEGHGKYLELAKAQGDILIVGVDTDEYTRKRKGDNRPIVPESERLRMLTFLRSVDIVTLRTLPASEKDIDYLHKALRPDVFVMSTTTKDFPQEKRAEIERYVGKVEIFEPQAETSSTARIRHLMIDGASELVKRLNSITQQFIDEMRGKP
ncbi:MAG: adenylyltransferase/cytidyltransferase family protein [Candidatus Pacebacteria bacterium]|jgi:D-beta-D-heptose 7-phosphate kinase/D-beta-D-heptose 1-phosphate adenosyltransferase|nr:adenylyltransferase/cytidyltransferase family protein [Candidatus Paceibacterota bacterium]